jgi:hypothetical protein
VPGMSDSERLILTPDAGKSTLFVRRKHVQNGVKSAG